MNEPPRGGSPAASPDGAGRLQITMLGALPPWRGVAPSTLLLLEELSRLDACDIEVLDFASLYPPFVYPGGDPIDRQAVRPSLPGVAVRRILAWYNPLSWIWAGLTLGGSVVHAQWWSYPLAPLYVVVLTLARLRGKSIVLTLHNVEPHEQSAWRRKLNRSVMNLADHFVVHSHENAATLCKIIPEAAGRVSVIPLGLHGAGSGPVDRRQARLRLGLPLDTSVVLAFGNIRPYKGLGVLLPAFRKMLDGGVDAVLAIVGQPWGDFAPYQELIDEFDLRESVHLRLEYVPEDEIAGYFGAADLAVYPYTHFDAQSAAATLALAFGVPVIVADAGGLPELVSDRRAVVPANDAGALAAALTAVLSDVALRDKLAADARAIASTLGWGAIAEQTAELYRSLVLEVAEQRAAA